MNECKKHQISKKGTLKLQKGKIVAGWVPLPKWVF